MYLLHRIEQAVNLQPQHVAVLVLVAHGQQHGAGVGGVDDQADREGHVVDIGRLGRERKGGRGGRLIMVMVDISATQPIKVFTFVHLPSYKD
jgi:hypothetical protein